MISIYRIVKMIIKQSEPLHKTHIEQDTHSESNEFLVTVALVATLSHHRRVYINKMPSRGWKRQQQTNIRRARRKISSTLRIDIVREKKHIYIPFSSTSSTPLIFHHPIYFTISLGVVDGAHFSKKKSEWDEFESIFFVLLLVMETRK